MQNSKETIRFFVILAICYAVWYALYFWWIEPDGRLNALIAYNIVAVTAGLLELFGYTIFVFDRVVGIMFSAGVEVIDGCTATEVIGLFVGFIIAYPGTNQMRLIFIPLGLFVIYLVNVFRIFGLALVQHHFPEYMDASHDYTANTIFYIAIFGLWVLWAIYGEEKHG